MQTGSPLSLTLFTLPTDSALAEYTQLTEQIVSYNTNPFTYALSGEYVSTGVVSVSVFDSNGNPVSVSGLDTPVVFDLASSTTASTNELVSLSEGFRCGYYNATLGAWTMTGVALVGYDTNDLPVCGTLHLSDFVGLSALTDELVESNTPAQGTADA